MRRWALKRAVVLLTLCLWQAPAFAQVSIEIDPLLVVCVEGDLRIEIDGDWTDNGTFDSACTGTVVFDGNATQTMTDPTGETFHNLTVNKSGGDLVLASAVTVNGSLTLANGQIDNSANSLTLGAGATIVQDSGTLAVAPATSGPVDVSYSSAGTVTTGVELPDEVNNFTVDSAEDVILGKDITVTGEMAINDGDLDLNGNRITLGPAATLMETPGNTVKGAGSMTTTRDLNAPSGLNVGGMGMEMTSSANMGPTTVTRSHTPMELPGQTVGIARHYDINPTNNSGLNAEMVMHYDDDEKNGKDPDFFEMYRSQDGGASWERMPGVHDPPGRTMRVSGVEKMSVWTIFATLPDIVAPIDPIEVETEITASVDFPDPAVLATHTAEWDWGDGTTSPGVEAGGAITGSHTYTAAAGAGVYTVQLTMTRTDAGSDPTTGVFRFVVVYDPAAGFVTGGGWITSPPGACHFGACTDETTGKATFGFVSKYKKGQSTPTGQTQFRFKAGGLNFHSSSYDWLVVNNHKAKYKGTGDINGSGNFGFLISAIDAEKTPSTDDDLFRMKIWDKDDGDALVYDNQVACAGDGDDVDPCTVLGGGNIKIHDGTGSTRLAEAGDEGEAAGPVEAADLVEVAEEVPEAYVLEGNYPNPFNPQTTIRFGLPEASHVKVIVYDVLGRVVATLVDEGRKAGWHHVQFEASSLPSGLYLYRITAGPFTETGRMILVK